MRGKSTLSSLLGRRWSRALAALGAYLLAVQAAGLPLFAFEPAAACCCAHRHADQRCNCKACTHARDLESNQPLLQTCGPAGDSPVVPALAPFAPTSIAAVARPLPRAPAIACAATAPPFSPPEVPTPPPLAPGHVRLS